MECLTRKLLLRLPHKTRSWARSYHLPACRSFIKAGKWVVLVRYWYLRPTLPHCSLEQNDRRTHCRAFGGRADSIRPLAVAGDVDHHRGTAPLGVFHGYDGHLGRPDSRGPLRFLDPKIRAIGCFCKTEQFVGERSRHLLPHHPCSQRAL